ncbi:MAG: class I SAM-dependent methyltransferase [Candidatus Omnitrophica bacterium]|nr:class I SAM-dependent methyltransferase [Candidatus Omnitrophota bacterium]MDD5352457.1 class I SAM-dependent methyltransferase [Candidatus Omnitrophota bacterium]MDD5550055.1 class I SAM-dependent methyltransferase [Candidatus Omnitrophota bacterium]
MGNHKQPSVDSAQYTHDYFMHAGGASEYLNNKLGEIYIRVMGLSESMTKNIEKKVILDLGCGRGELLREYAKRGDICYGVDYAQSAVDIAKESINALPKEQKENIYLIQKDLKEIDFKDNMFDVIFMLDVFEHLYTWELEIIIPKIRKMLKPNGVLIIHTYPTKWLINTIHFIMGILGVKSSSKHLHPNVQTAISMKRLLIPVFGSSAKIWYEKRKAFWCQNLGPDYNLILKRTAELLDIICDNYLISKVLTLPVLRHFFSTDIWCVARKNNP